MASGPSIWDNVALADKTRREAEAKAAATGKRSVVELDPSEVARIQDAKQQAAIKRADATLREGAMSTGEKVEDIVHSGATGVGRGVVGMPGAPVDIMRLGQLARAYSDYKLNPWADPKYKGGKDWQETLTLQDKEREAGQRGLVKPSTVEPYSGEAWIKSATPALPELAYEPKTGAGRVAQVGGEVVGSGALDPAIGLARGGTVAGTRAIMSRLAEQYGRGAVRNAVGGVASGVAGEASGGNPVAAIAAGAVGNKAAQAFSRDSAAARAAFGKSVPHDVTAAEVDAAERLFQDAQSRGLALSRANALDQVTGGRTRLSELQRVTESSGAEPYRGFYSGTEGAVERAGTQVLDQIAPPSAQPSLVGQRAAEGANAAITEATADVNRTTRPQYDVLEQRQAVPGELQRLMQDPAFADAYHRVMTSSDYASLRQGLPPDSAGVLDLVRRDMESRQTRLTTPGGEAEVGMNPTRAGGLEGPIQRTQQAASEASTPGGGPTLPGIPTPLEEVQRQQAILREQNVEPLQAGPEGRAARQLPQATTPGVVQAFFPKAPLENSHLEIGRAVGDLGRRDPAAARDLVRNYLGTELQRATTVNIPGEPYTSGAGFWKNVNGNPQQARNIDAALRALPNGAQNAEAFARLGEIFEAMGKRQHPGSKTSFNTEDLEALKKGGWTDAGIKALAGVGTTIPRAMVDKVESWRLGQNVDELANLFTDPARQADFRALALTRPGSAAQVAAFAHTLARLGPAGAISRTATDDDPGNRPLPTMRVPSGPRPAGGPR